ncbi:alpha-L-arabinofuranosidase C-terminal domain-containing protein [Sphingobium yanoikuyae]|uniref:non-reducing end alpha-L-arabinofuranosidase n=1 Tax=Sphingobium yanoikuyae TaxID=13690 RepID=A0A291N0A8_SPHYA|nr:alpha-L-arabinofuranosidase C-terminal domain-containing protein [Sphingobium yanoikuyae]ATI80779.1 alpha-N-arabinofuranosidase [Sphingobium yanoikuyae]
MRYARLSKMACGLILALSSVTVARAQSVRATVDTSRTSPAVTPYEYGMFIEPIGGLVNRTLWAEMLDDRKFYYPVRSEGKDEKVPDTVEGRPAPVFRKWRPIGGEEAVVMDSRDPFVGRHSPAVTLAGDAPRGLVQAGIAIKAGQDYVGHIQLSGDATARVEVMLIWGEGVRDREVVTLPAPQGRWTQLPLRFTAAKASADARLEVTGTGSGRFRIGALSLMPADNINGWRADTTAIARSLRSGMWRLPGGNFLSNWDWHRALGPRDKRVPIFDHAWSAMQTNDIGLDEWMELTRILEVEPYVTVNAGLGDANSAAEEVEYLNGAATSEWGAKRAANGHYAPYGVKWWNIGNEPYGWWQIGKTSLSYYLIKHKEFAAAMREKGPEIILIASGAMPDQLHPRDVKENPSLESIRRKFGTEEDWTGGFFAGAMGSFDGISEHWYDRGEDRPDAPADEELIEFARSPSNHVRMKAEEWNIYRQDFPAIDQANDGKGIFMSMDEYAYMAKDGATLKSALAYSMVIQEMLRHTDFLTMAAFTSGASTMDITPTDAVLNTTGLVFKLYGEHFGAGTVPVALNGNVPQPDPKHVVGSAHPQVKAGSATWPLDMVAALSPDGKMVRVAIVNATFRPQSVAIDMPAAKAKGSGKVWRIVAESLDAANKAGAKPKVSITQAEAPRWNGKLTVPPLSTSVFEYPLSPASAR